MNDKKLPEWPTSTVEAPNEAESPAHSKERDGLARDMRIKLKQSKPPSLKEAQPSQELRGEALTSREITPELVRDLSDYYRELFSNTMHFAVCPPCESKGENARLTAREIFGAGKEFVPLAQIDGLENMPLCPCCQQKTQLIYDPDTLRNNFDQKLLGSEKSFLSLLRKGDDSIAGLAFAYITSLKRELALEWGSKYPYMKSELQRPEYQRSLERFLDCVGQILSGYSSDGNEAVLAWNCISVSPEAKGGLSLLLRNLFNKIPEEVRDLMILGDVKKGSYAHTIFRAAGGRDGTLFFEEGESDILVGGKTAWAIDSYTLSPEQFRKKKHLLKNPLKKTERR